VTVREFIRDYLTFTRKERIAILLIAALILFTLFLPDILSSYAGKQPPQMDTGWIAAVKKLEIKVPDSSQDHYAKNDDEKSYAYQFDKTKSSYNEDPIMKG
jgi:hypothetical protein